jgi:N-acetylglutamate synthase-like GNAT family acetyltransferase
MRSVELEVAVPRDVEALVGLRDDAARWLLRHGIEQWRPGEFTAERMSAWVGRGHVHVLRERGRIAACVAILWEDPDTWGDVAEDAGYIHLLVVRGDKRGTGLGDGLLRWAELHVGGSGRQLARLDAVSSNRALQDWYEQRGYAEVGQDIFDDGQRFPVTLRQKHLHP